MPHVPGSTICALFPKPGTQPRTLHTGLPFWPHYNLEGWPHVLLHSVLDPFYKARRPCALRGPILVQLKKKKNAIDRSRSDQPLPGTLAFGMPLAAHPCRTHCKGPSLPCSPPRLLPPCAPTMREPTRQYSLATVSTPCSFGLWARLCLHSIGECGLSSTYLPSPARRPSPAPGCWLDGRTRALCLEPDLFLLSVAGFCFTGITPSVECFLLRRACLKFHTLPSVHRWGRGFQKPLEWGIDASEVCRLKLQCPLVCTTLMLRYFSVGNKGLYPEGSAWFFSQGTSLKQKT